MYLCCVVNIFFPQQQNLNYLCNYNDKNIMFFTGIGAESVLEAFGDYFIKYVLENGYDTMLRTLGDTFESFIQNLDSLHSMLKLTYSKLSAPSFR